MKKSKEKITNDQKHIIDAIKKKNYGYVWEKIKYIGIDQESDMKIRYLLFKKAIRDFDISNNNFIMFYKNTLSLYRFRSGKTFFTNNYKYRNLLLREKISPENIDNEVVDILKNWEI